MYNYQARPMSNEEWAKYKNKPLQKLLSVMSDEFYNQKKNMIGKVLTIIDAVAKDEEQRKALKDLASQMLWSEEINAGEIFNQFGQKYDGKLIEKLDYLNEKSDSLMNNQSYFPDSSE
jgi:hypothetical protein